jgi:tetratricopeptide (TPR) repeat protein
MSEGARYRQKARDFEQRENWKRAIEAYELAIESDHLMDRDVDLALYNRVGDLYRRIGDVNRAVEYYEMAVDGHLAAGFYNNAIALCNKILRNKPNFHSAYLKLGKIGAAKGFLSDARRHFLEYAERMQQAGQLDAAFAALVEFADLSPDPEVRLMIADQLIEHDRNDMAVEQLRLAWRDLSKDGRESDAQEVRERILDMAPDRDPEVDPPEASSFAGVDAEGILELPELPPYEPRPRGKRESELEPPVEPDSELAGDAATEVGSEGVEPLDIETRGVKTLDAVPINAEGVVVEAIEVEELEAEPAGESLEIEPTSLAGDGVDTESMLESPAGEEGLDILPTELGLGEGAEEEPAAAVGAEVEAVPVDRIAELEARLGIEGREPGLLVGYADALLEVGETDRATEYLEQALGIYDARGEPRGVGHVLDELLRLNVNDVRAYQKRVELALKAADRGALIEAYLGLADCLDRTDASNKARVVFNRVLELDPGNERAAAALEMFAEEAAPEQARGVGGEPSSNEYVDLGSLVAEEEPEEKSTRFIVPTADPQSESDVNFAEMLDQFRSRVSEAIEKEDTSSHYDLGLAFKDMGLIDEAIAEFQIAARGHEYRLRAIEMLGACFLEKEDYRIALKVLGRALQVPGHTDEELVGIFYSLGQAYEALGEAGSALEWYERVLGCDVHFKDVSRRVSSLRQ